MIDLPRAYAAFASYVKNYNPQDGKVRLKIVHTEHVAAISRWLNSLAYCMISAALSRSGGMATSVIF